MLFWLRGNLQILSGLFEYLYVFAAQTLNSKQSAKGYERIIREILRRSGYFKNMALILILFFGLQNNLKINIEKKNTLRVMKYFFKEYRLHPSRQQMFGKKRKSFSSSNFHD